MNTYRKRALVSTWQAVVEACSDRLNDDPGFTILRDRITEGITGQDPDELAEFSLDRAEWDLLCWVYGPTESFEEVAL